MRCVHLLAFFLAFGIISPPHLISPILAEEATSPSAEVERVVIGRSWGGREILAERFGTPGGNVVLLVGLLHGNERGASRVLTSLRSEFSTYGSSADVWIISNANPDGVIRRTRSNARGVDLNRNFPARDWSISAQGRHYSGRSAASEPETRAIANFIRERRPVLSIWFHQVGPMVDAQGRGDRRLIKRYAALTGYPFVPACAATCSGTATMFHRDTVRNATAFVVELPMRVTRQEAESNVYATRTVMQLLEARQRSG